MTDPPFPLHDAGQRLWSAVCGRYVLDAHEALVLFEACRTADTIEALESERGADLYSATGGKVHPGIIEARQQRTTLARLVASLRLPLSDEQEAHRKQRRTMRGVHEIGV